MGSPMNTFRSGSSITRMGRFLVAMGGRGRSAREAIQWHSNYFGNFKNHGCVTFLNITLCSFSTLTCDTYLSYLASI